VDRRLLSHRAVPRRAIFLAVALVLTPGCWLFHGRGDPSTGAPDAGWHSTPVYDAGHIFIDAPDSFDAARPDAPPSGLRCEPQRADVSCFESFLVAPGRAFELPFAFDQCGCCIDTECAVAIDASTQTLSLTTTLCPDPCDCDACVLPTGACSVPPLEEGLWRVVMNGAAAFELPVFGDGGRTPPPPACASYADVDRCEPAFPFAGMPVPPSDACVTTGRSRSTLDLLRVHEPCSSCGLLAGPCYAALVPRGTDDLPPGGDLHVDASEYGTACDVDCPDVCVPQDRECIVPALVPGDTYRVFLGEELVSTFIAGEPSALCPD
jgi:hypothetical protein